VGLYPLFHAFGCVTVKVYSFEEMPKYIVHFFLGTNMAGEEDELERCIRESRMHKGKVAMTNSHQKELQAENLYVPKTRKRRDARLGGDGS